MEKLPRLISGGLVRSLPPPLRQAVANIGADIRYDPDEIIHLRGDAKPGLSIVVSGAVLISITNSYGKRVTATRFGPGDSFGEFTLFAGLPRTHDATAINGTHINQITKPRFFALMDREPQLRDYLLAHMTRMLAAAAELIDDERRLPLKTRFGKMLLTYAQRTETATPLAATQTDLADHFGVSRVAMGTAIAHLRERQLIDTGYGEIIIRDAAALRAWVAEETGLELLEARTS